MKIKKIHIKNYKSIKEIKIYPNEGLNAFIGENSVGKSNIFSALNWLLGKTWPTFNQTTINDHYLGLEENLIYICIEFDDNISFILDESIEEYSFGIFNGGTRITRGANNSFREKYCIGYLDTSREIVDYLPSNKWSLVGRILQDVNNAFSSQTMPHPKKKDENGEALNVPKKEFLAECLSFAKEKILFTVEDEDGSNIMKKFIHILQTETANQLNRKPEEFLVDFNLYDPWNFYKTLQILVKEENGLTFQASSLGMGVQASITIAILKAYAELNLRNKPAIFIDEPELYLHPQAQRNFYQILRELAKDKIDSTTGEVFPGVQVFYNTHSPDFLSAGYFNEVFLVRKNPIKGTYVSIGEVEKFCKDLKIRKGITSSSDDFLLYMKNAYEETGDSQKANEGFFAKKIILVEGQTETWVIPYFFEKIGFNYTKEGITIVRCGCKDEIDRFYRLYSEFGIPCYIIFDGDNHNIGTADENSTIEKNHNILRLLGETALDFPNNMVHDKYLGFASKIENNLGIPIGANSKSLAILKKIKNEPSYIVPTWVHEVIEKLKALDNLPVDSILLD